MILLLACTLPGYVARNDVIEPLNERPQAVLDTSVPQPPPESQDTSPPPPAIPEAPAILLNEVASNNRSLYSNSYGEKPDYIELYNASTETVSLSRLMLRDGSGGLWAGGEGEMAPGTFYLIEADAGLHSGQAPFSLDADGDTLEVMVDGQQTDRLSTGKMPKDIVWARFPDGGDWSPSIYPSPNLSNGSEATTSLDPSDRIFQFDEIIPIDITLSSQSVSSLYQNRLSYVEGAVVVDGVSYENVGVRLKSYVGSSRTLDQKCAWKIDLNRYDSNGEYAGVETLTINNMVQDQSYIHERLAYMLYQAVGVPAPRVGYARVSMNGTDYGLYAVIETLDENMLSRWFGDGTGTLYEGAYGVDLYPGYENSFDFKQGDDPTNRSDLSTVIDILQRSPTDANLAELEQHVDMDNILLNRAVESAILHWDGYTTANNYRLYHDPISDRFYMLPWGADQTFVDYWYGPWSGRGQLWTWCVQNPSCSERYDQKLMEVTDIMMGLDLPDEAERLARFLYDDIQTDPRREFSVSYWQYRYDATITTLNDYPTALQAQVLAH